MAHSKNNIVYGPEIPKYLLDSKSNLSQYYIRMLGEFGNKTALIDVHDGASLTFANILMTSFNIADWLKYECGIQKSDVVGIFSENTIWYPSIVLATWHIGAICAFFNPMYSNKELTHVLNISKPKIMITSKMGLNIVKDTTRQLHFVKYVVPMNIICSPKTFKENNKFVPTNYDNSETCAILFSSGTTGLPKGVELSHRSLLLLTIVLNINDPFITSNDTLMGLVPMFHGYGVLVICSCLSVGNKMIVHKYFDEELFLKSIEIHKITVLFAVPPLMVFLAKHPLVDKYNLSSLNVVYCGAAPLSKDIENQVSTRISKEKHLAVVQGYGMTELCIVVTFHSKYSVGCAKGSVGSLMFGMLGKVIDVTNGKPLPENQIGELCFKGPMVMKGYYSNPTETSLTIDSEGWLHTGDVGYYDKDYQFYIVDRIKELIKYKGYQVAPAELESLLLTHPEIDDAAVTGLPNLESGELPMAFVVKSSKSTVTEKDVIDFVNKQVSSQKRLRGGVQFVNSIPKNPSGKILRRVLKDLLKQSKL